MYPKKIGYLAVLVLVKTMLWSIVSCLRRIKLLFRYDFHPIIVIFWQSVRQQRNITIEANELTRAITYMILNTMNMGLSRNIGRTNKFIFVMIDIYS